MLRIHLRMCMIVCSMEAIGIGLCLLGLPLFRYRLGEKLALTGSILTFLGTAVWLSYLLWIVMNAVL